MVRNEGAVFLEPKDLSTANRVTDLRIKYAGRRLRRRYRLMRLYSRDPWG
jgi:hypothetical protein